MDAFEGVVQCPACRRYCDPETADRCPHCNAWMPEPETEEEA